MQHVIRQYQDCCDGIYLFGDLSALDFYRKLGFAEGVQYQYTLKSKYCRQTAAQPAFQPVDKQDALRMQTCLMRRYMMAAMITAYSIWEQNWKAFKKKSCFFHIFHMLNVSELYILHVLCVCLNKLHIFLQRQRFGVVEPLNVVHSLLPHSNCFLFCLNAFCYDLQIQAVRQSKRFR